MTDKLREAAQQDIRCECCGYMTHHREHLGCIRAAALSQQDAHMQPASEADMTVYLGIAANYHKDKVALTQQDAQAVAQDEIVAAWKSGMTVQYFVTIGHDDEWTDYTNPTPPDTSGTRLAWRVKPGQRSNTAPTPPAQRVMLTDDEIEAFYFANFSMGRLKAFARDVIEAYERKNGLKP